MLERNTNAMCACWKELLIDKLDKLALIQQIIVIPGKLQYLLKKALIVMHTNI